MEEERAARAGDVEAPANGIQLRQFRFEQAPSPLHLLVPPIADEKLERRRDRRETRRDE